MVWYSPQDVYARKLLSHRGYPLWTPEPNVALPECYRREGLKIGDVGIVAPQDGGFDVFFNITLPREHRLHAAHGVPDNFTPVELKREDYRVNPDAENPGCPILSSTMKCDVSCVDPFYVDGVVYKQTRYRFSQGRKEGAMLILPQGAESHCLSSTLVFFDVAIQNAIVWYRFAREQLYRDIGGDALYLITGFHKAQSWSLASFQGVRISSARCKITQRKNTGSVLSDSSAWEPARPLEWRIGPRQTDVRGIPNQTVFIVGFKIAVNKGLSGRRRATVRVNPSARGLARHFKFGASLPAWPFGTQDIDISSETSSQGEGVDGSRREDPVEHLIVQSVPQILQPFHPSDIINRYMLEKEPSAKFAVTHDSQWIALLERGILDPQDMIREGRLAAAVSREYDIIERDGVVYLQTIVYVVQSAQESLASYRWISQSKPTGVDNDQVETVAAGASMSMGILQSSKSQRSPRKVTGKERITHTIATSSLYCDIIFLGQTGAGKTSVINMIRDLPDFAQGAGRVSNDASPCTTELTYNATTIQGITCTLWDIPGLDETPGDQEGLLRRLTGQNFYHITQRLEEELRGRTMGGTPILVWCIDAAKKNIPSQYELFRKVYVEYCHQNALPIIVLTQMSLAEEGGWRTECRAQLRKLGLGRGSNSAHLARVRRYQGASSTHYKEDAQALKDIIRKLILTRHEKHITKVMSPYAPSPADLSLKLPGVREEHLTKAMSPRAPSPADLSLELPGASEEHLTEVMSPHTPSPVDLPFELLGAREEHIKVMPPRAPSPTDLPFKLPGTGEEHVTKIMPPHAPSPTDLPFKLPGLSEEHVTKVMPPRAPSPTDFPFKSPGTREEHVTKVMSRRTPIPADSPFKFPGTGEEHIKKAIPPRASSPTGLPFKLPGAR